MPLQLVVADREEVYNFLSLDLFKEEEVSLSLTNKISPYILNRARKPNKEKVCSVFEA